MPLDSEAQTPAAPVEGTAGFTDWLQRATTLECMWLAGVGCACTFGLLSRSGGALDPAKFARAAQAAPRVAAAAAAAAKKPPKKTNRKKK